ncbi:MAG: F0F1 ATP synthase subunit epsilon [Anaerolineae bacterium]
MSSETAGVVLLRILTPERTVYDGAVEWVQIPLEDGMIGVWPGHAPLVAATAAGTVTRMEAGVEVESPLGPGILLIDGTHCVVLYSDSGAELNETDLDGLVENMETALEEAIGENQLSEILEAKG